MRKKLASALAVLVAAVGLQAAAPPAALAGEYGCGGTLVGSWPVPLEDRLTGATHYRSDVWLYHDSDTGWNCAVLVKRPGHERYGQATPLAIQMYDSAWGEDGWEAGYDGDTGDFRFYAGPVRVYGRDTCVHIRASHGDHIGPGEPLYDGNLDLGPLACT
ncbi:hypothetical protein [Marinitenerispora sediminis]|uniref:Secreted protein n=1 Tax=Marinitenerispora sediminis TaxID=1931232 RepID=A0A368T200_9ACTN|nr:hypothetical protein [Marinitenerispora sediminis]RCV51572.1 hypothetical protein DEF28_15230 [Marinitenerispora sediminis]RCV54442.1 hypothetical protein DEF24_19220 [Marinitenerispora sediminis]RCV55645.1 hypothetical protein DEF23_14025 [Marinitenerispora sediminis]